MALLNAKSPDGTPWIAPVQITVWASGDTITGETIGSRGVVAIVANTSGGSLDFRVEDPGKTPAGGSAANGYTTYTIATATTVPIFIGPNNINGTTQAVKVGASTSNAAFTVTLIRY